MNYKNDFFVPSGTDFDKSVYLHIRRTQEATLEEDKMVVKKDYEINGIIYTVHSIFNIESQCSVDDKLRYLMQNDAEKTS